MSMSKNISRHTLQDPAATVAGIDTLCLTPVVRKQHPISMVSHNPMTAGLLAQIFDA